MCQRKLFTRNWTCRPLVMAWLLFALVYSEEGSIQKIEVSTLSRVLGEDGAEVTVPCLMKIRPQMPEEPDFILRWIKYFYGDGNNQHYVYTYNGEEGRPEQAMEEGVSGKYSRTGLNLTIPVMKLVDEGKLCCEVTLLPDMTTMDTNCTCLHYVDSPPDPWTAVLKDNTSLIDEPEYYMSAVPPVTLELDVGYREIYPACDLALYRRTTKDGNDILTELDRKTALQGTVVNGRYSLLLEAKLSVGCTGAMDISRLVAKIENCHYGNRVHRLNDNCWLSDIAPPNKFELEKHFTIVCKEECRQPCQNGGTCNSSRCLCPKTHMGARCECVKPNNPCKSAECDYCMNGGTCVFVGKARQALCECPHQWTGEVCEYPSDGGGERRGGRGKEGGDAKKHSLAAEHMGAVVVVGALVPAGLVSAVAVYVVFFKLKKRSPGVGGSSSQRTLVKTLQSPTNDN